MRLLTEEAGALLVVARVPNAPGKLSDPFLVVLGTPTVPWDIDRGITPQDLGLESTVGSDEVPCPNCPSQWRSPRIGPLERAPPGRKRSSPWKRQTLTPFLPSTDSKPSALSSLPLMAATTPAHCLRGPHFTRHPVSRRYPKANRPSLQHACRKKKRPTSPASGFISPPFRYLRTTGSPSAL